MDINTNGRTTLKVRAALATVAVCSVVAISVAQHECRRRLTFSPVSAGVQCRCHTNRRLADVTPHLASLLPPTLHSSYLFLKFFMFICTEQTNYLQIISGHEQYGYEFQLNIILLSLLNES